MFWKGDNMPNILFLIFTYFAEALIVYSYGRSIYDLKKNKYFSFGIILLFYALLLLLFQFLIDNEVVNIFSIIFVNILIISILFKSSLKSAIFHGFALGISQLVSEFTTAFVTAMILSESTQESVQNHFEIGSVLSMIIYFLMTRLLTVFSIKENKSRSWGKWFSLSLLPIESILVITNDVLLNIVENTFMIIAISFLLLVNIIVYFIYEQSEKNNQKLIELEIVNQKNNIDMQYLNLIEKKNEKMQIMAHDYKNHMIAISNMSDSIEIKEYINDMMGEITKYSQIGKTQNRLLDVILSKYTDICNDNGINFEIEIISDNLKSINDFDMSTLFNNLLDNAVDAASQSLEKFIHLEITNSLNSYHKIILINSCDTEPESRNNILITTKKNKGIHGFGTKSIDKIVNKYSGETQWNYDRESRQFKLIIVVPENKS